MLMDDITGLQGIRVGQAGNLRAGTGCTVVLTEGDWLGGVAVRGGAPGTRETALLDPLAGMDQINALLLTGGSAFGLEAASGIMDFLEERGIGYDTGSTRVPIVPGAVIYDLDYGQSNPRPDRDMAYQACRDACEGSQLNPGNTGVGLGATVGKIRGMKYCDKSGVGSSLLQVGQLQVGALTVCNALGDIRDPQTGDIIAGARRENGEFLDTRQFILSQPLPPRDLAARNTTLGVIVTNARLDKAMVNKIAGMAHDGLARAVSPVHTMFDGDIIFALASGQVEAEVNQVGVLAAEAIAESIVAGINNL